MNKIMEMKAITKNEMSYEEYIKQIAQNVLEIQNNGLEVELQYGNESSVIIGRKVVYSAEEL